MNVITLSKRKKQIDLDLPVYISTDYSQLTIDTVKCCVRYKIDTSWYKKEYHLIQGSIDRILEKIVFKYKVGKLIHLQQSYEIKDVHVEYVDKIIDDFKFKIPTFVLFSDVKNNNEYILKIRDAKLNNLLNGIT